MTYDAISCTNWKSRLVSSRVVTLLTVSITENNCQYLASNYTSAQTLVRRALTRGGGSTTLPLADKINMLKHGTFSFSTPCVNVGCIICTSSNFMSWSTSSCELHTPRQTSNGVSTNYLSDQRIRVHCQLKFSYFPNITRNTIHDWPHPKCPKVVGT